METQLETHPDLVDPQTQDCDPSAACLAVEECVIDSGCVLSSAAFCFCGPDVDNCDAPGFVPTGPCESQIRAAVGSAPTNAEIFEFYMSDPGNPAGLAILLSAAAASACIDADQCELTPQ